MVEVTVRACRFTRQGKCACRRMHACMHAQLRGDTPPPPPLISPTPTHVRPPAPMRGRDRERETGGRGRRRRGGDEQRQETAREQEDNHDDAPHLVTESEREGVDRRPLLTQGAQQPLHAGTCVPPVPRGVEEVKGQARQHVASLLCNPSQGL
jgi:hypothetical protein